ncbi:MAG: hypothetical protein J6V95_00905 [Bacteroidaceae bacterium]|nr:hypothetical protein [Bacteroidaceae bacterium]
MKKRIACLFAVTAMLSFAGLSAQERGFYLVADGSYGFNGQYGYDSNDRDYVQVKTSGNTRWREPYRNNSDWKASVGTGFMFGDKGQGARFAIELGVGLGGNLTKYKYSKRGDTFDPDKLYYPHTDNRDSHNQGHFNSDNGYNTRARLLSAHISMIRRINLGGGFILEPRLTAGFDFAGRSHYGDDPDYWYGDFNTGMYRISFTPFVLEHRFEKNRHFAVKAELGSISYMRCETEWVKEEYQIFDVNLNRFTAGIVYYFRK